MLTHLHSIIKPSISGDYFQQNKHVLSGLYLQDRKFYPKK